MAAKQRRFSISLPDDLEELLCVVHNEKYSDTSIAKMLRDLIARGLVYQQEVVSENRFTNRG